MTGDLPTCTTCPYCGVGCGVLASPDGKGIEGDPDHPANFGRLCSKGAALGQTIGLEGRLLSPLINGRPAGWEEATRLTADRFKEAIASHGPDSVAMYVSGQLLTEDYYVANKFMKGYVGSANIDTNSRLCMASSVAGHKRAFGTDTVPGTYEDLEAADLIVLVGSNLAWCHPVLYQRIVAAKAARPAMRVVNVDPRVTATSDLADLQLSVAPGSDVALFNGLLARIAEQGAIDSRFVADHVNGFADALETARADALGAAETTGLAQQTLDAFYEMWMRTEKVVTVYSQGVNQSSAGTDKVNAILNCHLATGRIGQPGMGPFSVTGQPNAMGGREVGGLANTLACHLDIGTPAHREAVQAFWQSPTICREQGLKAVDLFRACQDGRIKALWIMSTNPAVSMPEADAVRAAIEACPFVVVSDLFADTDTAALADVVLPAAGWGEKSGTVTNSDRTISRQRPFLPVPGEARPDWRIVSDVARQMGWESGFAYSGPAEIFREHARLSGLATGLGLDFDITGFAEIDDAAYENLRPTRWPFPAGRAEARAERFFGDGRFFTPDSRARMIPVVHRPFAARTTAAHPFRLNTGRVRDHWHTMTRSARAPRLSQHIAEPYAEIHPEDALDLEVRPADLVEVASRHGRAILRALVTERTPRGVVFVPMHWTAQFSSEGRIDAAVRAEVDPVSGQPELKGAAVSVMPYRPAWYAFAVSDAPVAPAALTQCTYWARARTAGGWRVEFAGVGEPDWLALLPDLFGSGDAADVISLSDAHRRTTRLAVVRGGRATSLLFAGPEPVSVSRDFVIGALAGSPSPATLLAGVPGGDRQDPGAMVCSCFDVGVNTISDAIQEQGLTTVEQIGAALQAGTNCGSCRPELKRLLTTRVVQMAAE